MSQHTEHSSYREKLIEHLFVGELLKLSWQHHECNLEVAKPEVDNSGYDFVLEANGVVRHVQVKTSIVGGTTASQKIHLKLEEKPSGCVLWIYFKEDSLELGPFLYYGGKPSESMESIKHRKTAKHTKGNKTGFKAERPNLRVLPKGAFTKLTTISAVYAQLFGEA